MYRRFGYAEDFKIIIDSSVTLQIDAAGLRKLGNEDFMQLNLSKCSLMVFKRYALVRIGGVEVEEFATQKDLGLRFYSSLTWTSQAKCRCGKAIKSFHLIRRNICDSADSDTRLFLYKGCFARILSFWAILRNVLENDLNIITKESLEFDFKVLSHWLMAIKKY